MLYIIRRRHWWDIVLNVHASNEDKSDDTTDSFYEELERVLDQLPKYYIEMLSG